MEIDVIKALSKTKKAIKSIYKSDGVYYDDLMLLSLVLERSKECKVTAFSLTGDFPEFSYKFKARLAKMVSSGYLVNSMVGRVSDYKVTIKGELLLKRYADLLEELVKS